MFEIIDDALPHQPVQSRDPDRLTRACVYRPANGDLQNVIVAVAERVIAFSIQTLILFLRQTNRVQPVRCGEFIPSRD